MPDYTAMQSHSQFDEVKAEVNGLLKQYLEKMESVNLREALSVAMHIAQAGNNFLQSNRFGEYFKSVYFFFGKALRNNKHLDMT